MTTSLTTDQRSRDEVKASILAQVEELAEMARTKRNPHVIRELDQFVADAGRLP